MVENQGLQITQAWTGFYPELLDKVPTGLLERRERIGGSEVRLQRGAQRDHGVGVGRVVEIDEHATEDAKDHRLGRRDVPAVEHRFTHADELRFAEPGRGQHGAHSVGVAQRERAGRDRPAAGVGCPGRRRPR